MIRVPLPFPLDISDLHVPPGTNVQGGLTSEMLRRGLITDPLLTGAGRKQPERTVDTAQQDDKTPRKAPVERS